MKIHGDAVAWCLIVLLTAWNAYLSLQLQEQGRIQNEDLSDTVARSIDNLEQSSMTSISLLIKDAQKNAQTVTDGLALQAARPAPTSDPRTNEKLTELHGKIAALSRAVGDIQLVVSGQENIDGLRAHYQRSAFDTVMKRIKPWHSGPDPNLGRSRSRGDGDAALITAAGEALSEPGADPARRGADGDAAPPAEKPRKKNKARAVLEADLPANVKAAYLKLKTSGDQRRSLKSVDEADEYDDVIPDFLFVLPTFKRAMLHDGTEYLRRALGGLAGQYKGELAKRKVVQVLVVNNSPDTHTGVEDAVAEVLESTGSGMPVFVVNGSAPFDDPVSEEYHVKVDLPSKPDVLESWTPSRRHCRHLAESFSKAMGFPARYVMLWEDDMLMCGDQERGTISSLFDFVDKANAASPDWTGLRLGFGGNGLVLHWSDIPHVGDYLLANMHRRPPDWLLTEWYKGLTYTSQMSIGSRHKGFTNQLNLFDHIGDHSSFPGRENQGAKDSKSHVNYNIPKCFDYNWWLLPEERPTHDCDSAGMTPCQ